MTLNAREFFDNVMIDVKENGYGDWKDIGKYVRKEFSRLGIESTRPAKLAPSVFVKYPDIDPREGMVMLDGRQGVIRSLTIPMFFPALMIRRGGEWGQFLAELLNMRLQFKHAKMKTEQLVCKVIVNLSYSLWDADTALSIAQESGQVMAEIVRGMIDSGRKVIYADIDEIVYLGDVYHAEQCRELGQIDDRHDALFGCGSSVALVDDYRTITKRRVHSGERSQQRYIDKCHAQMVESLESFTK